MRFTLQSVGPSDPLRNERGVGLVFIISAPSGTGKTTLVRGVMEQLPGLTFSVSYTTRLPRPNEKEGEDYHFVSHSTFQRMIQGNQFLEWAEVLGNFYGTPRPDLKRMESEGIDLILDIDPQGAKQAVQEVSSAVLIYLLPPSLKVLRERLMNRGMDSIEMIKFRLSNAKKEMEEAHWYHYVIINDQMDQAIEKLKCIIIAERCRKLKRFVLHENQKKWEDRDGSNHC